MTMTAPSSFKILHISDLHFGGKNTEKIKQRCTQIAQKAQRHNIDFIVVTGDIFLEGGSAKKMKFFVNAMKNLQDRLNLGTERFLFVPGNHDVNLGMSSIFEKFKYYIKAVNAFYHDSDVDRKTISWPFECIPIDRLRTSVFIPRIGDFNVQFLLFNSVWDYDEKRINIPERHLTNLDNNVPEEEIIEEETNEVRPIRIALVHNTPLYYSKNCKTIKNADQFLELLRKFKVSLLLHGDRHESGQAASSRELASWPLYVLGAGHINPDVPGIPHFHIISIRGWDEAKSLEIDVISYKTKSTGAKYDGNESYNLCVPSKTVEESAGSIHRFELPDASGSRGKIKNIVATDLLFSARYKSFETLFDVCVNILGEKHTAKFPPDLMYLLFYEYIFNPRTPGGFFCAVHDHNWKAWLEDPSIMSSLKEHRNAAINGHVDVKRVIILKPGDVTKISLSPNEEGKLLLRLCRNLRKFGIEKSESGGCFKTYLTLKKRIPWYYSKATEINFERHPPDAKEIWPGNIALYSQADVLSHISHTNTVVFYFEKPSRNGMYQACISIDKKRINFIKGLIDSLFGRLDNFTNCQTIKSYDDIKKFLNQW